MRSRIHKQNSPPRRTSLIARYCLAVAVFLALFLVLGGAPVSASLFPEYRITYANYAGPGRPARPRISGHIVAWLHPAYRTEERNEGTASAADVSNIEEPLFLYDVPDLSGSGLTDDFAFEGDILTWSSYVSSCEYWLAIYIYDLANPLAEDNYLTQYNTPCYGYWPVTNGSVVIYLSTDMYPPRGYATKHWTMRVYVPHWRATFSLIDEIHEDGDHMDESCPPYYPTPPCIDGDTIVWTEFETGKVRGFDVFERKHFVISEVWGFARCISGDFVLLERPLGTRLTVISYVDISDRDNPIEFPIATVPVPVWPPSMGMCSVGSQIDGNIVVWQDYRNGNWDIYGYDITSGTEFQITDDPAYQGCPDIDGHTVVWMDYRHVSPEIYAANISSAFGPVCVAPVQGDINDDCKVDFTDFVLLTQNWLDCNLDPPSACWE